MKSLRSQAALALSALAMLCPQAGASTFDDLLRTLPASARSRMHDAIEAAPKLEANLDTLVASGALREVRVLTDGQKPVIKRLGREDRHFDAAAIDTGITITGKLLDELRSNWETDVVSEDDVLPDNTVFVLAHLAYHLEHAQELNSIFGDFEAKVKTGLEHAHETNQKFDATQALKDFLDRKEQDEAHALIAAWNRTVEAAERKVGGTLSPIQMYSLLANLRYRAPFERAIQAGKGESGLRLLSNGIEQNQTNVDALAEHLVLSDVE